MLLLLVLHLLAGGRFELRQLQEAALRVATQGGAVQVAKARCTDTSLDSSVPGKVFGGGAIEVSGGPVCGSGRRVRGVMSWALWRRQL